MSLRTAVLGLGFDAGPMQPGATQATRALRGVRTAARGATGEFSKFQRQTITLGAAVNVASVAIQSLRAVGQIAGLYFDLGTAVEETASKYKTVFGPAVGETNAFLEDFNRISGLTRQESQELIASAGALTQAFGFTQDASAAFSAEILRVGGDLNSFNNSAGGTEGATRAVLRALSGERESLKLLNVVLNEADIKQRALTSSSVDLSDGFSKQEKAAVSLELIIEQMGVQYGDLDRTQQSSANRARVVAAGFRELRDTMGVQLVAAFKQVDDALDGLPGAFEVAGKGVFALGTVMRLMILNFQGVALWADIAAKGVTAWYQAITPGGVGSGDALGAFSDDLEAIPGRIRGLFDSFVEAQRFALDPTGANDFFANLFGGDTPGGPSSSGDPLAAEFKRVDLLREIIGINRETGELETDAINARRELAGILDRQRDQVDDLNTSLGDRLRLTQSILETEKLIEGATRQPGRGLVGGVSGVQRPEDFFGRRQLTNNQTGPDPIEVLARSRLAEFFEDLDENAESLSGTLALFDRDLGQAAGSLVGVIRSIQAARGADSFGGGLLGAAGAAGFAIGLIGQLTGESPEERQRRELLSTNNRRLADLTARLGSGALGIRGSDFETAQSIATRALEEFGDLPDFIRDGIHLDEASAEFATLARVAGQLGLEFDGTLGAVEQLRQALEKDILGAFTETFSGRSNLLRQEFALLDINDPGEQFQRIRGELLGLLSPEFAARVGGLDDNNFDAFVQEFLARLRSGDKSLFSDLDGVTPQEFLEFLGLAEGALDRLATTADAVSSALLNVPEAYKVERARLEAADAIGVGEALQVGSLTVQVVAPSIPDTKTAEGREAARLAATAVADQLAEVWQGRRAQGGPTTLDFAVDPQATNPNVLGGL